MSLHLALSTAHCPFFHFSHLLILVVPQIVIYHIHTYIIKSRVHMAVFCLFCCPISFLSLLKVLHQRENIRCLPFWVIFILQLSKTPLCVYIQLQPFICRWPSRLVSWVFAAKPDNRCWISIPCGEGESGWPLVFRDLPSCRFLLCPTSMPQAQCLLLLSSVQIFCLYFPSLVPLFSITFLHPLLASVGPSWETLETRPLLLYTLLFLWKGTCIYRWGRIWATW